jgi:hypothetical protein
MDPSTIPVDAIISEFGVPRYDSLPLNDPDVRPRPFRQHASLLLSKQPRLMCIHAPVDSRRIDLWNDPEKRLTVRNWTIDGYSDWLINTPRDVLPYVGCPLLADEPQLLGDMINSAERFKEYRHNLMP